MRRRIIVSYVGPKFEAKVVEWRESWLYDSPSAWRSPGEEDFATRNTAVWSHRRPEQAFAKALAWIQRAERRDQEESVRNAFRDPRGTFTKEFGTGPGPMVIAAGPGPTGPTGPSGQAG